MSSDSEREAEIRRWWHHPDVDFLLQALDAARAEAAAGREAAERFFTDATNLTETADRAINVACDRADAAEAQLAGARAGLVAIRKRVREYAGTVSALAMGDIDAIARRALTDATGSVKR